MFPLICAVLVILTPLALMRLSPARRKMRQQVRFIRETLAANLAFDSQRVIASLSTVPGRINNLSATIQSLLKQTHPPDEIVLAIPEFSIREERPYVVPEYLLHFPRLRILRSQRDWGPATKFIPIIREELAGGRRDTVIMVVDDDRVYPRDAKGRDRAANGAIQAAGGERARCHQEGEVRGRRDSWDASESDR